MSQTHNDKLRLLSEAPDLIARAVKAGWLSYPKEQKFKEDGSLDPMLCTVEDYKHQPRYTEQQLLKAYELRQRGISLNDCAKVLGVSRGSIVYLVSRGHELWLAKQRQDTLTPEQLQPPTE